MAKRKTKEMPRAGVQLPGADASGARAADEQAQQVLSRPFSAKEYLLLNALFDAFCLFQLLVVRMVLHETRGLYYFFGLLMVGFGLVSVFDFVCDRFLSSRQESLEG